MTITELIITLNQILSQHGDLRVIYRNGDFEYLPVDQVDTIKTTLVAGEITKVSCQTSLLTETMLQIK